jgi:hypothetical protein
MFNNLKFGLALSAATLLFVGCSSDSNSGGYNPPSPSTYNTLRGIVSDPPIERARVELVYDNGSLIEAQCGVNSNAPCSVYSSTDGSFRLDIPKTFDADGTYLIAYGGRDTVYNIHLDKLIFTAPIAMFTPDATGDYNEIVISPLTSLVADMLLSNSINIEDAADKVKNALNITNADIAMNPMNDSELLKAAYLVTKTAQLKSEQDDYDPIGTLAGVLTSTTDTLASDAVLDAVFGTGAQADAMKLSIKNTAAAFAGFEGDADGMVEIIADSERYQLFAEAVNNVVFDMTDPAHPAVPSDFTAPAYLANVKLLYDQVGSLVDVMPMNKFSANQMVKYILAFDGYFKDYNNYISGIGFPAKVTALFGTELANSLNYLSSENINAVSLPLDTPLGDNSARARYYLSSNIDYNYIARGFIDRLVLLGTADDALSDTVYDNIVVSYAKMGMQEKAFNLVKTNIRDSLARAAALSMGAYWAGTYGLIEGSVPLVAEAESILNSIRDGSAAMSASLASAYLDLALGYDMLMMPEKSGEIRGNLINTVKTAANLTDVEKFTIIRSIFEGMNNLVDLSLYPNGQYKLSIDTLDYVLDHIDDLPADVSSPTNQRYRHINSLNNAMGYYHKNLHAMDESERSDTLVAYVKSQIGKAFDKMIAYNDEGTTAASRFQTAYKNSSGVLYWALGEAKMDEYYALYYSGLSAANKLDYYKNLAVEVSKSKTITDAISTYETGNSFNSAAYTNLSDWVNILAYTNIYTHGDGFASAAIRRKDYAGAEEALTWITAKLDDAAAYFISQDAATVRSKLTIMIGGTSETNATTKMQDYSTAGYLKVVKLYGDIISSDAPQSIKDNALTKAIEILGRAKDFTGQADNYIAKANAYAAIAGYYRIFGKTADMQSAYTLAHSVANLIEVTLSAPLDYFSFYNSLSMLTRFSGDPNGKAVADKMYAQAKLIASDSVIVEADLRREVTSLITTADTYYRLNETGAAASALEDAIMAAKLIPTVTTKVTDFTTIISKYAAIGMTDIAYEKTLELILTVPERNNAIAEIAKTLTSRNDFGYSPVAYVDTDKDGKPDFFIPGISQALIDRSGLELDDDTDNDGKFDTDDLTPFYAD